MNQSNTSLPDNFKSKLTQLFKLVLQLISLLFSTAGTFAIVATIFVVILQILHFIESGHWVNFTPEILFGKCYCPFFTHDIIQKVGLSGMLFSTGIVLLFGGYLVNLSSTRTVLVTIKLNRATPSVET
ncbi:hypothetical protein [Spartinivicinus ruber]|uniref:hypothetical protein n=1 Tax=Spartinivicinus ruber TaxID=2683272 RepID=UPI0013D629F0|nr:hypothetical protein [Spartinivicinus ruber]